jgi:hypothetical protein
MKTLKKSPPVARWHRIFGEKDWHGMSKTLDLKQRWQRYQERAAEAPEIMARFDALPPQVRCVLNLVPLTVDFAEKAVKRYGADEAARRILDPDAIYCFYSGEIMVGEEGRRFAEEHTLVAVTGDGEDGKFCAGRASLNARGTAICFEESQR